jgi:hypothetical protein
MQSKIGNVGKVYYSGIQSAGVEGLRVMSLYVSLTEPFDNSGHALVEEQIGYLVVPAAISTKWSADSG